MTSADPANLRGALWYAAHWGVLVAPADADKKKPAIKTGRLHAEHSSRDPAVIHGWRQWSESGTRVAIITGELSGVLVIDCDIKPGMNGLDSLRELEDSIAPLPDTPTQDTAHGAQLVFRYPVGAQISNSVCKLAPGVDVRGNGGIIIAPPASDRRWRVDTHPTNTGLAELPERWVRALVGLDSTTSAPAQTLPPVIVEGEGRNAALFSLSCAMRRRGLDASEMLPTVNAVNARRCKPPLDAEEISRIVASAARYVPAASLETRRDDFEARVAAGVGL